MKKLLVPLVAVVLLFGLAVLLNPSPQAHRTRIQAAIGERSPIAGALGLGALAAFISSYRSVGVGSYTVVNDRVASVGAFGWVLVMDGAPGR